MINAGWSMLAEETALSEGGSDSVLEVVARWLYWTGQAQGLLEYFPSSLAAAS